MKWCFPFLSPPLMLQLWSVLHTKTTLPDPSAGRAAPTSQLKLQLTSLWWGWTHPSAPGLEPAALAQGAAGFDYCSSQSSWEQGTANPSARPPNWPQSSPGQHKTHPPKCSRHRPPLSSIPSGVSRGTELTAHPGCKNLPGTGPDQDDEFLTSSETTNHSRATTNPISKNRTYQPCCFSADKSVFSLEG